MKKLLFVILAILLYATATVTAQVPDHEVSLIKEMAAEEQEIVDAIVLYPKDIRASIFEASTHPQVIVKLSSIQKKTSEQFKELMMEYPIDVQKSVWEMSRYPDLINQLATNPANADDIISRQSEEVQEMAHLMMNTQYPLLKKVAELEVLSYSAFNNVIAPLPEASRSVFKKLIQYPEVLGLLNENIEFTILGGDLYKKYPNWVEAYADSLNLVVARQQAIELEDWKTELENDPEALKELKEASQSFADEFDLDTEAIDKEKDQEVIDDIYYTEDDYNYDDEEYDYEDVEYRTVYREHYYHYPYWFGYPYWYTYPHWRPYPYWYEWGFYWNSYGGIYIYHMPSPFFMHWYFHYPRHHYHYAHLSNHFVNHYYGHRTSRSSITGTVHSWRESNREVIRDNWTTINKAERIKTLKEYGKMENARVAYNEKNPKNPYSKKDYIVKNKSKYPTLNRTVNQKVQREVPVSKPENKRIDPQKPNVQPVPKRPEVQTKPQKPTKRENPKVRVEPNVKKPQVQPKPNTKVNPVPKKPTQRKTNKSVELKKASDYHKQTWNVPNSRTPVYKQPAPKPKAPKVQPKPKAKPKTKTRKPN